MSKDPIDAAIIEHINGWANSTYGWSGGEAERLESKAAHDAECVRRIRAALAAQPVAQAQALLKEFDGLTELSTAHIRERWAKDAAAMLRKIAGVDARPTLEFISVDGVDYAAFTAPDRTPPQLEVFDSRGVCHHTGDRVGGAGGPEHCVDCGAKVGWSYTAGGCGGANVGAMPIEASNPVQAEAPSEPMRAHIEQFATRAGWKMEEGEGAFEFVQRKCYQQGWIDHGTKSRDREDDTSASQDQGPDTGRVSGESGPAAEQHNEHRTGQSGADREHDQRDCRGAGLHGASNLPPQVAQKPDFIYNGERGRDAEDLLDGYNHGTAFYASPVLLRIDRAIEPLTSGEIRALMAKHGIAFANINTVEALVRDVELEHGRGVANPKARAAHSPASGVVEREEGARIWIDQKETTPTQVVGKLLRSIPDEFLVTAERDNENDDWYIRVTNSGGYKDYDGYWRSSARKTADEVMLEAARGAMVPLASTPPPVPALDVQGERIERLEGCRRALEIIAVGDAQSPQVQAAEELIALGFWRDIPQARSAPPPLALVAPLSEEQHAQIYERLHRVGGELNFVSPIAYGKEVERAHGIVTKEGT